jgi:hypothetical protein
MSHKSLAKNEDPYKWIRRAEHLRSAACSQSLQQVKIETKRPTAKMPPDIHAASMNQWPGLGEESFEKSSLL